MAKLAVLFPGIGYTTEKPLLYYGLDVAYEMGYKEYRKINYVYEKKGDIRTSPELMEATFYELYAQAEKQLADLDFGKYDEILFVSKSLGTIVATCYAEKYHLTGVKHVLYTPLKYTYAFHPQNAVAFIGSSDAWSDYKEIVSLSEASDIPIYVYENCNHSLETKDVFHNLELIQDVMHKTKDFLNR